MKKEPVSVAVCVLVRDGHILLLKRVKDPYAGYWSLPAGKIKHGEHVSEAAVREAFEETGLVTDFSNHLGIVSEHITENGGLIFHSLMHVCELEQKTTEIRESNEGALKWFPLSGIEKTEHVIIPSDLLMITKLRANPEKKYYDCVMEKVGADHVIHKFE
jgi:8-oxo-dGTP diphosphatase